MACSQAPQWFLHSLIMSQTKTGASRFQGRLFKSAATSALALSALTGGLILSGGEGKAQSFCTPPNDANGNMIPGPADCTVADPTVGLQQTRASILPGPPSNPIPPLPAGTNVNYELTSLFYPLAQTQIDTDFNAPYAGGLLVGPTYTVQGLNGTKIDGIDLSAAGIGAFTVKKEVFSDSTLTTKIAELNLTGAGFVPVIPLSPISQIWIRDTYNNPVAGQSSIDNVENTVRTPGPLAILGAGTAFGFSRKLRGRIKASRTA
jgi:hypothetical protein